MSGEHRARPIQGGAEHEGRDVLLLGGGSLPDQMERHRSEPHVQPRSAAIALVHNLPSWNVRTLCVCSECSVCHIADRPGHMHSRRRV